MRTATDRLTLALIALSTQGKRPRCGDPETHHYWLSDEQDERAAAATWCSGCPILEACGEAAEEKREKFGVWAGVDRTPQSVRPKVTA